MSSSSSAFSLASGYMQEKKQSEVSEFEFLALHCFRVSNSACSLAHYVFDEMRLSLRLTLACYFSGILLCSIGHWGSLGLEKGELISTLYYLRHWLTFKCLIQERSFFDGLESLPASKKVIQQAIEAVVKKYGILFIAYEVLYYVSEIIEILQQLAKEEQGAIKSRHLRLLKSALELEISTSQLSDLWDSSGKPRLETLC
ncbi:O-fucosyltransferase 39-like isoform X1 [Senna tora]|uniref:O-fucosyltransferase 39-like isoform X1 n=1 Tax=Senna tora TaxID=362788 RepID=A0A834W1R6_9FABA|nr:O-fucosyltransferase 39-like isoform X1 [Senna tora]